MPSVAQVSMPSALHLADHRGDRSMSRSFGERQAAPMQKRVAPASFAACARVAHFLERHQLLALEAGVVADALRAVRAVLGAGAGLDREQRAHLHRVRLVVRAVRGLRAEDEVRERQGEQRLDLGDRPVVSDARVHAQPFMC